MTVGNIHAEGFFKIRDADSGEVILDKTNAIHFENLSESLALSLANKPNGRIYQMSFGNGGVSVDPTGSLAYLPPNITGQNADLYNQTYFKVVDDTAAANTDPAKNRLTVVHTPGKYYTDIVVSCLLDYGEPLGQQAFDNATNTDGEFVFDELGIKTWNGSGTNLKLITHAIFHPIQKALNRRFVIEYTIRIQTLSSMTTNR